MVYKVVQQSAVLKPTATLGVVTSGPCVSVSRLGSEHFITAPVGHSFHIYDADDLQLKYLSRPLMSEISGCFSIGEITFVCLSKQILVFHKMVLLATLEGHNENVRLLANIGDSFLVSTSTSETLVWKLPNFTRHTHAVETPLKPFATLDIGYQVSALIHMPTYTNKMLIAGSDGSLELWNINAGKRIYQFTSVHKGSQITCLAASPAIDVAGIGYADGTVQIINLKSDEIVMTLLQTEHGAVSSMAFRADYTEGMLVTGTVSGDLIIWDLSKRSIHSLLRSVHPKGVGSLAFLDTLPLLVSSGTCDNAISIHFFDKPDGGCRLLKERRGFTTDLQFLLPYGDNDLIVAGDNGEVGRVNLIQSQQNKVWSQSSLSCQTPGKNSMMPWRFRNLSHLPKIVSIGHTGESKMRHFDWPSIVTAHEGIAEAYVWSAHQQALVTRLLMIPRKATTGSRPPALTAVAVSPCGNYAVVGNADGELHRFNLQSCYHRGLIAKLSSPPRQIVFLTSREILVADKNLLQQYRVVPRPELMRTVQCVSDIKSVAVHGFMCAVAHESAVGTVSIVDMQADRKARTITDLSGSHITALAWSRGGRWLAVASQDKRMIIYDVPTGTIIDRVEFNSPCKTIEFTQNNAQIITCHENGKGAVRVWQNIALLEGPGIVGKRAYKIDDVAEQGHDDVEEEDIVVTSVDKRQKIENGEFTLFPGSRTRWQQILKLDEIKERNKPKQAPEKPKNAPFFLPVKYKGMEPVFVAPETPEMIETFEQVDQFKREQAVSMEDVSEFVRLVCREEFGKISTHFLNLEPAGVHLCIGELEDGGEKAIGSFVKFLTHATRSGRNLDLVATWTNLFLAHYGKTTLSTLGYEQMVSDLSLACAQAYSKFNTRTNELQCLLKVAAALQLHR